MEPPLLFLGLFYATTILLKLPNMFPTTNLSKPPTLVTFSLYASVARLLLFYLTIVIFVCFDDSLEKEYVRQRDIARGSSRARLRHDRSRFSVVLFLLSLFLRRGSGQRTRTTSDSGDRCAH